MSVYRHLLVAVDLTEDSARVVRHAAALAERMGSRITLLHVVEYIPVDPAGEALLPPPVDMEDELIDSARRRLDRLAGELGLGETDSLVEIGQTRSEIKRLAAEHEADLIVLGSRERHGLALLLGTTERSVIHNAPCDVLVVRLEEDSDD
jgi:universal stress protein A